MPSYRSTLRTTSIGPRGAATQPSFEVCVCRYADRFAASLHGLLGRDAESRGGRIAVEDALQDAFMAIYRQWPRLRDVSEDERERRMSRCVRDAAGRALRKEHGRREAVTPHPQVVAFGFGTKPCDARDGAIAAAVHAATAVTEDPVARLVLDRDVLVTAMGALTERERLVLGHVDLLDRDQQQVARELNISDANLRCTLTNARRLCHGLVRHALGVGPDDDERSRLAAYRAGALSSRTERRTLRRHLQHCEVCRGLLAP